MFLRKCVTFTKQGKLSSADLSALRNDSICRRILEDSVRRPILEDDESSPSTCSSPSGGAFIFIDV